MMKSKVATVILMFMLVLSLASCSNSLNEKQEPPENSEIQTEEETEKEEETETPLENETEESQQGMTEPDKENIEQSTVDETVVVKVYYGNVDGTAFESSEVQIASLSPEAVLDALVSQGALTADVAENSFTVSTVDGKASIELDLNSAFATYVSNMGTTGEYYTVGALVNTFLDAYECEQIRITVDGDTLSTGHAEYPGYLSRFE